MHEKKKLLSLFSGCGGMDIGFSGGFWCNEKSVNSEMHPDWVERKKDGKILLRPTDFETIFANDILPFAKTAWVSYFSQHYKDAEKRYHLESVVDLVKHAKSGDFTFPSNIDIVTGGFPCQDFSVAGKRLGFNSEKSHTGNIRTTDEPSVESRGQLYIWMKEVITLTKPKLFIAENVKGLVNLADAKKIIERDFSEAADGGYLVVDATVLNAARYGVPQNRERVIFLGFKKNALQKNAFNALMAKNIPSEYNPYPSPTHSYKKSEVGLAPLVTSRDALSDLSEPEFSSDLSQQKYSKAKYMGHQCQGQNEINLDDIAPTIRSEHHGNIEFRRLSASHGGKYFLELSQGLHERRLTVRECARIQTFPDEYQFILQGTEKSMGVSASSAYKIIGNAVPCMLAYNIAKNIEHKWDLYFGSDK